MLESRAGRRNGDYKARRPRLRCESGDGTADYRGSRVLLGGYVGDQLALQHEDLILEHELALLEAFELELVVQGVVFQGFYGSVQIAVLQVQLADTPLYFLAIFQRHGRHRQCPPRFRKPYSGRAY